MSSNKEKLLPGYDRRWFTRIPYRGKVFVKTPDGNQVEAEVRNLSLRGILVTTEDIIPVGRSVDVIFPSKESERLLDIAISGRVVWSDEKGFGIEFERADIQNFLKVKNIIITKLPADITNHEILRYFSRDAK
ncbi:MAG: PilZ domain-containing protein [Deltaproteobacteria bacterium]|nr:PilZ domain-containing protein [Deltaproteobacteria bacterium]MBW2069522.1 PilZ domain-containing protein [Deltaproteobacteria bacterium]